MQRCHAAALVNVGDNRRPILAGRLCSRGWVMDVPEARFEPLDIATAAVWHCAPLTVPAREQSES